MPLSKPMAAEAQRLIERLGLVPHPEGGWYRETHRTPATVTTQNGAIRNAGTSIYFLLTSGFFSAFHRIASDETWHFYRGDPVLVDVIADDGGCERHEIGVGDAFQCTVPAGAWFASHVEGESGYALVGCDVAPGFDFADFEMAACAELSARFSAHAELIARYTRR